MSRETMTTLEELRTTLNAYSYAFGTEEALQAGVAATLTEAGWTFESQASLGAGDRPDFLVEGRIAVELKVDGSANEVTRQLNRYCRHASVEAVVLVTSRIKHRGVPAALAGTPIEVVYVGEGLA